MSHDNWMGESFLSTLWWGARLPLIVPLMSRRFWLVWMLLLQGFSIPDLHVMRSLDSGQKRRALDHPTYRILNRRPNAWQTAMEFRETMTMHAALTGNAYALRVLKNGALVELLPLMPDWVRIEERGRYERWYIVQDSFGMIGEFRPDQIFHLRSRCWDLVKGLDCVSKARSAIGLSIAAEENIAALQSNGGETWRHFIYGTKTRE